MPEYQVGGKKRLAEWLADRGIVAVIADRGAAGVYLIADVEIANLDYSDEYVPLAVRQATAFLKQRADAGDNVARATLVCLRYVNSRLE